MAKNLSKKDYEFMNSLGGALLETTPRRMRMVFIFWAVTILAVIIWMSLAEVDEITRGSGEIVPSGNNQMIQNLEGGIVEEILINSGDMVNKGQILLKIDNQKSKSSYTSNEQSLNALEAQILRLEAEASGKEMEVTSAMLEEMPMIILHEQSLHKSNLQQFNSKVKSLHEQKIQRSQELIEAKNRIKLLSRDQKLITQELEMIEPMVKKGIKSQIDLLKLQREENSITKELSGTKLSIVRLKSAVTEMDERISEEKYSFQIQAKEKLTELVSKMQRAQTDGSELKDRVSRTLVRSPIKGIVQELFVHTVGGVVKPGADLVELVPTDDTLLVEVQVKPSDIAFIYADQRAKVKFSAYDFAIFGGLEGKVVNISADSVTDKQGNVFFKVRIKTDKNHLGNDKKPLKIIPGMTVDVDIITGKKTILDYVLKPILKSKQYSFSER